MSVKKEILNFDAADIAEILSELNEELLIKFFRLLPKDIAAETFSFLELDSQQIIINSNASGMAEYCKAVIEAFNKFFK